MIFNFINKRTSSKITVPQVKTSKGLVEVVVELCALLLSLLSFWTVINPIIKKVTEIIQEKHKSITIKQQYKYVYVCM